MSFAAVAAVGGVFTTVSFAAVFLTIINTSEKNTMMAKAATIAMIIDSSNLNSFFSSTAFSSINGLFIT